MVIVVAEPNGGKTTIFAHLAGEMVQAGYRVFYVNADISGSDAAEFIEASKAGKWTALLPDLIPGMSMQDVIERLETDERKRRRPGRRGVHLRHAQEDDRRHQQDQRQGAAQADALADRQGHDRSSFWATRTSTRTRMASRSTRAPATCAPMPTN
jgi:hypothetical protein